MDARSKAKQKQLIKQQNRAKCLAGNLPKTYSRAPKFPEEFPKQTQQPNVPRPLMVAKLKQETKMMLEEKGEFIKQGAQVDKSLPSRQERRKKLTTMVRNTLRMLRGKGVQQAPKNVA
jgi:hypothetical protein